MNKPNKFNNFLTATIFSVAVFLIFAIVFVPFDTNMASANTTDAIFFDSANGWMADYETYIADTNKDWYLDEQYLDIMGAIEEVEKMLADPNFDKETLKSDPVVVAVIENGISAAYIENANGTFTRVGVSAITTNPQGYDVKYGLHPIFKDVILKDQNGNYIYENVVKTLSFNGTDYTIPLTGNIAQDMVSFSNHGTGVTGIIAYLIQKCGLQDYIKILPIKADDWYGYIDGVWSQIYRADALKDAVASAYAHGVDIVNYSISAMPKDALTEDMARDMQIVQSAGNESVSVTDRFPAVRDDVLGVMNYVKDTEGKLVFAESSNWGDIFDIVAPGDNAVIPDSMGGYTTMGGTSASTPFASFGMALANFRYKGYKGYGTGVDLNSKAYKEMIAHCSDQKAYKTVGSDEIDYPALDYKNILAHDFFNDVEYLEKIGVDLDTLLSISSNVQDVQHFGDKITLTATTNPRGVLARKTPHWWYEIDGNTQDIGDGWQVEFTIPYVAGDYKIYCSIENGDNDICPANPIDVNVDYFAPTGVDILGDVRSEYMVDNTGVVLLSATISNEYAQTDDTLYWWYEIGGNSYDIGTGMTVQFSIPKEAGEYAIKCAFKNDEGDYYAYNTNTIQFVVKYYAPEDCQVVKPTEEEFELGDSVTFTLPADKLDPEIVEEIKWYVNDILMAEGAEYNFQFVVNGKYDVTVVVDGQTRNVASYTIGELENENPNPPVENPPVEEQNPPVDDKPETPQVDNNEDGPWLMVLGIFAGIEGGGNLGACIGSIQKEKITQRIKQALYKPKIST